jgi:hypothetical protein
LFCVVLKAGNPIIFRKRASSLSSSSSASVLPFYFESICIASSGAGSLTLESGGRVSLPRVVAEADGWQQSEGEAYGGERVRTGALAPFLTGERDRDP